MKQHPSRVNSVEKALKILLAFHRSQPLWGVRELSAQLGFSPATVQRALQVLKNYGFVDQDPETRQYRLGCVYYHFLDTLQSSFPLTRVAVPFMKQLSTATQETVHLNVIDGQERVCIDHIESPQHLRASMPIGNRSPLHAGASSKCLLAFSTDEFIEQYLANAALVALTADTIVDKNQLQTELSQIRFQGYALSLGERTVGLGSLSAPVLNHNTTILAAVSLAIPELRFNNQPHRETCLAALRRVAGDLSRAMGHGDACGVSEIRFHL
jgi:DNA-binding IclR family transcriptional regulator